MKKQNLMKLCAAVALASVVFMTACNPKGGKQEQPETPATDIPEAAEKTYTKADFMYLDDEGNLCFYYVADAMTVKYPGETADIRNYIFKPNSKVLLYSVCEGENVVLKSIDFEAENPEAVKIVDWGLTEEECTTETYGSFGEILVSKDGRFIGIRHDFDWDCYCLTKIRVYDFEQQNFIDDRENYMLFYNDDYDNNDDPFGEVYDNLETETKVIKEESFDEDGFYIPAENDTKLFYKQNCLSDKMDFGQGAEEMGGFCVSPTGERVYYYAILDWGDYAHGNYCVSSLDGKVQIVLHDTDIADGTTQIAWLKDGSLVYLGYEITEEESEDGDFKSIIKYLAADGTSLMNLVSANGFLVMPR